MLLAIWCIYLYTHVHVHVRRITRPVYTCILCISCTLCTVKLFFCVHVPCMGTYTFLCLRCNTQVYRNLYVCTCTSVPLSTQTHISTKVNTNDMPTVSKYMYRTFNKYCHLFVVVAVATRTTDPSHLVTHCITFQHGIIYGKPLHMHARNKYKTHTCKCTNNNHMYKCTCKHSTCLADLETSHLGMESPCCGLLHDICHY